MGPLITFKGNLARLNDGLLIITSSAFSRENGMDIITRAATLIYSNFKAVSAKMPYDELRPKGLVELTGYKQGFFDNVGRGPLVIVLVRKKKMQSIFDGIKGNMTLKAQ